MILALIDTLVGKTITDIAYDASKAVVTLGTKDGAEYVMRHPAGWLEVVSDDIAIPPLGEVVRAEEYRDWTSYKVTRFVIETDHARQVYRWVSTNPGAFGDYATFEQTKEGSKK